ncbi:nuclear hormone receptor family member nhr-18-like [Portunus trituberculatus]|uniref:nuclear hormone receptor family member nhr-18-like n=1 Tax=Portunus trituberculatus TaxID=210409 RepID=UPI001E1D0844|nr:nuclear hormone receptor family member nhr-18-like [Portunus trituberculatus]
MASGHSPSVAPPTSAHRQCLVCLDPISTYTRDGVTACRACRAFFRRQSLRPSQGVACPRRGDCQQVRRGPAACAPCRLRRCLDAGLSADPMSSSQETSEEDRSLCHSCNQVNRLKGILTCSQCGRVHHLSCAKITQAQAAVITVWHCNDCLRSSLLQDAVHDAVPANETPPTDMAAALAALRARTRLLQHVPPPSPPPRCFGSRQCHYSRP